MLRAGSPHQHAALGDSGGAQQRSCLDSVGNGPVYRAMKALHAQNGDGLRARAGYAGPHLVQAVGQIHDLRLLGRVFQHGQAPGQRCGHHQVFRCAHAGQIQIDARPGKTARKLTFAAQRVNLCAKRLQALQMQINGPLADSAAPGQTHAGAAAAGQNGAQNQNAGPKAAHVLLMQRAPGLQRADGNLAAAAVHLSAAVPQDGQQRFHIRDARYFLQYQWFLRQKPRSQKRQHRVLGGVHLHLAAQNGAVTDEISCHVHPSCRGHFDPGAKAA